MTATVTAPEISTPWESRPASEGARWSLNEITARSTELLPGTKKRQMERAKGLAHLLEWLGTFPGDSWQQRWIAAGCDQAGTSWGQQDLIPYRKSLQGSAVIALVVLGIVRPSMLWLRTATPPHMFITYRSVVDSETFAQLDEKLSNFPPVENLQNVGPERDDPPEDPYRCPAAERHGITVPKCRS
jgi:hypothetical protein